MKQVKCILGFHRYELDKYSICLDCHKQKKPSLIKRLFPWWFEDWDKVASDNTEKLNDLFKNMILNK